MPALLIALLAAVLLAAGCGGDDDAPADEGPAPAELGEGGGPEAEAEEEPAEAAEAAERAEKPKPTGTEIKTAGSQFGQILFDGEDQAIYLFDLETSDESQCYDDCAEAWPPVLTKGEPQAGGAIREGKLGTTKRDDGTTQVTYNGHPLYYYAHEGPGEVKCHNVPGFGGLWLVLDAAGDALS